MAPLKLCPTCGKKRPESAFYRRPNGNPRSECKRCEDAARQARRDAAKPTVDDAAAFGPSGYIIDAVVSGDAMDVLVALRNRIAAEIDSPLCPARDLSSLTLRLQDILAQIKALKAEWEAETREASDGPARDEDWDPDKV